MVVELELAALRLEEGAIAPGDPVVVRIDGPAEARSAFVFVIDGVDASGLARREGDAFVLDVPLDPGSHALLVVMDGFTRQSYEISVEERRVLRGRTRLDSTSDVTDRLAEKNVLIPREVDRAEGHSSLQWRSELEYGPWKVSTFAPLTYDSSGKESGLGRRWDLANYLGTLERGPFLFQVGEHSAGVSSLILQGFQRRGFSLRANGPADTFVTGFLFHTQPTTGFRERMGISDESQRLWGASLGSERIGLGELGTLFLATSFLHATGGEGGVGTAGLGLRGAGTPQGDAVDGTFELGMFDGAMVVGGDYAHTRFDFDGGGGEGSEADDAWLVYAQFEPLQGVDLRGHAVDARLAYQEGESGPFFRSLGNAGAPSDVHNRSLDLDLRWAGLAFVAGWVRLDDNVDDNEQVTTYADETWSVDVSYTPVVRGEPRWRRWLGTPTLQTGWSRQRSKPIDHFPEPIPLYDKMGLPTGDFAEPPALYDATTREIYGAARTSFGRWGIGASYTKRYFEQKANSFSDTISRSWSGQIYATPHPRLSVSLDGSRESTTVRDPSRKTVTKRLGFSMRPDLVPGRLDASIRVDWQHVRATPRNSDGSDLLLSGETTWHVWAPRGIRPGVRMSLLGTYRDVIDRLERSNSLDSFQVFFKIDLLWSPELSWGGGRTP